MSVTRRLAAILAADVIGFSRLMQGHAFTSLVQLLLARPSRAGTAQQGPLLKV